MGGSKQESAAIIGKVNWLGSGEAQNFSSRKEENGRGFACTLGSIPCCEEENGLVAIALNPVDGMPVIP
jgi:hypothetical protein